MTRLVDDVLDVARITRGAVDLRLGEVELAEVVRHAIETSAPLIERHQHRLVVEIPDQGLRVHADAERLAQVISNLLTNAAKYTPPGGEVRVVGRRQGSRITLTVSDTGVGLAAEDLHRIFEMFVQGRQGLDRAQGGLGLGLTIARSLTRLHQGDLTVTSPGINQGSTFCVELPMASAVSNAPSTIPIEVSEAPPQGAGMSILVVDDNRDVALSLSDLLGTWGYRPIVAFDGPHALELVRSQSVPLALIDLGLPVMDGYELGAALRHAQPRCQLVAITGYGQASDITRSHAAGFVEHLTKPVEIARLGAVLSRLTDAVAGRSVHEVRSPMP
jgi:CheY-like chemotaxis protein